MTRLQKLILFLLISMVMVGSVAIPRFTIEAAHLRSPIAAPSQSGVFSPLATRSVSDNGWEQLGGNPQHTSFVDEALSADWRVKWIWNGPAKAGEGPASDHLQLPQDIQPVMGDGKMFIGHSDGVVRAIDLQTGKPVWESQNLEGAIVNTAAFDAETNSLYTATSNGRFWRLDAATGKVIRSNRPGGEILMAPLLVGKVVFIGTTSGLFYAFDKVELTQAFPVYQAGAPLIATPGYSGTHGGLVVLLVEDKSIHCLQAYGLTLRWKTDVNGDVDPKRGTVFADTYPVISEANDLVVVRSYLDWEKMWLPEGGAPSDVEGIRDFLRGNPTYQSMFVLDLDTGESRYIAPVMGGAIGNGGDFEAPPPQVVIRKLVNGEEVAYLLWRSREACRGTCDPREDTTIGEMVLPTGEIRFVQDYKNEGSMRFPTDEQSPLSMAGDVLLHAHWMLLGAIRITDRSAGLGSEYASPIRSEEMSPVLNTVAPGTCAGSTNYTCSSPMDVPCDGFSVDAGFFVYSAGECIYDAFWTTPVRGAAIHQKTVYWKTVDGAVVALGNQ